MRLLGQAERLEKYKCEFEAMLTVLTARTACAADSLDWQIIRQQALELVNVAKRAHSEARMIEGK